MSGTERGVAKGEIHNYKNEYKFNYELGQKANGEYQIKSVKIRSDIEDQLSGLMANKVKEIEKAMEDKGFKMVKPVGSND